MSNEKQDLEMLKKKPVKSVKRKSKVPNPVKRKRKNPIEIITSKFHQVGEDGKYYIIIYNDFPVISNMKRSRSPRSHYDILKWDWEDQFEFHAEGYIKISNGELIRYDNIIKIIGPFDSKQNVTDYLT